MQIINSNQYLPNEINTLPDSPGVYRFYNKNKILIYVGKAKNIKKRVTNYFNNSKQHNIKTQRLVEEICSIEFTIVNSEYEALLLENNIIKSSQPKYNILLKDDKTYPYISIIKERFPRVIPNRNISMGFGRHYGPFTSSKVMYQFIEFIKSLYPLRTCNYNLSEKNIQSAKFKPCLEYHIGNCDAPCIAKQTEESYNNTITQVEHILKGNFGFAKKEFKEKMLLASKNMEYEKAQQYKEKLDTLEAYQAKSLVINPQTGDLDVFAIISDEGIAFVSYIKIKSGAIMFARTIELAKKLEESDNDILQLVIVDFIGRYSSQAKEILCNIPLLVDIPNICITIPQVGDKKKLVMLAMENVLFAKKDWLMKQSNNEASPKHALLMLQKDLQLKKPPTHIECFDNSNICGTNPVAAMVCFKNGEPAKRDYRHFDIKTVSGPNDFASMREVVFRRYSALLEDNITLPDLIVVDGGKGQLSAAIDALKELNIYEQVQIISIAKKLEEIFIPGDSNALHISKKSASLKLLQRIRNEAHRFAIKFHRNKRSKNSLHSALEDIPGIGVKTIEKLLLHFKSLDGIKKATIEEVSSIVGKKAVDIVAFFKK